MKKSLGLQDFESYRALAAKRLEIQIGLNEARKQYVAAEDARERASNTAAVRDAAAMRLLGEQSSSTDALPDVASAKREVAAYTRALEIVTQQLADEGYRVARIIGEQKLPEYRAIIKKQAKALADLRAAAVEEQAFRDDAVQGDWTLTAAGIRPMSFRSGVGMRSTDDLLFQIDAWTNEAKEYEMI